jgi:anti-sigma-K factor RskA
MKETLEELACLYVLDQLDPSERAVFEARMVREPELAALVRQFEETVATSIRALPQVEPPSTAIARIEARISQPAPAMLPPRPSGRTREFAWGSFARWGLAAVVALSLSTIAVQSLRRGPSAPMIIFVGLDSNRNTFTELPVHDQANDPDARFIELASMAEKYWEKSGELPANSNLTLSEGRGYALIDPASMQGFIAVEQLPPISENQRYHVWVVDPNSHLVRDAGVLPLSGRNSGLYSFVLGTAEDEKPMRPNIFITVEDAGATSSPSQPRGKVVLGDRRI